MKDKIIDTLFAYNEAMMRLEKERDATLEADYYRIRNNTTNTFAELINSFYQGGKK